MMTRNAAAYQNLGPLEAVIEHRRLETRFHEAARVVVNLDPPRAVTTSAEWIDITNRIIALERHRDVIDDLMMITLRLQELRLLPPVVGARQALGFGRALYNVNRLITELTKIRDRKDPTQWEDNPPTPPAE